MPAPLIKTLLLSLSLLSALGVAALQNPQVQAWLEDQRRRIGELLRSIGEELDPESRRAAEAFAFEGKTPATHEGLRREVSGSKEAVAVATGRSLATVSAAAGIGESVVGLRRIAVKGLGDADEAEERRRKGREYLAKRNQRMYELKESRRGAAKAEGVATPPSPTSFDELVDVEGKLKGRAVEGLETLPSPPTIDPVPEAIMEDMREVERQLAQPQLAEASSSGTSAFQWGARLANPFSDDFDLERSTTPKPSYISPTAASEHEEEEPVSQPMPGSFSPPSPPPTEAAPYPETAHEELSYEEQLAIALSLSEADELAAANAAIAREQNPQTEDDDLRAAIQASLREMNGSSRAAYALAPGGALSPRLRPLREVGPEGEGKLTDEQMEGYARTLLDATRPGCSRAVDQMAGGGDLTVEQMEGYARNLLEAARPGCLRAVEQTAGEDNSRTNEANAGRREAAARLLLDLATAPSNQPLAPISPPPHLVSGEWAFYDPSLSHPNTPVAEAAQPSAPAEVEEEEDELYRLTPQLTRARLHAHQGAIATPPPSHNSETENARTEAAANNLFTLASRASAPAPAPATQESPSVTRVADASYHFAIKSESESSSSETFASLSQSGSLHSANEEAEVVVDPMEIASDATWSDDDEMDGVLTPDSWTEVGSMDGFESEGVRMEDAPV